MAGSFQPVFPKMLEQTCLVSSKVREGGEKRKEKEAVEISVGFDSYTYVIYSTLKSITIMMIDLSYGTRISRGMNYDGDVDDGLR